MVSKIKKFKDAYATMTVAVYEPLVLKWVSEYGLREIASINASRAPVADIMKEKPDAPIAGEISFGTPKPPSLPGEPELGPPGSGGGIGGNPGLPPLDPPGPGGGFYAEGIENPRPAPEGPRTALASPGRPLGARFEPTSDLARSENSLEGRTAVLDSENSSINAMLLERKESVASIANNGLNELIGDYDLALERDHLFLQLKNKALESLEQDVPLGLAIQKLVTTNNKPYYGFLPADGVEEVLSPIGIAHFYRQLYYYVDEGYGPIEQCFTVAPKELIKISISSRRKQIQEEVMELGSEVVSERALEERNEYEVSDKVSSMLQRNLSASMSVSASYTVPVFQAHAQASGSMDTSSQRSKSTATRQLKNVTKRASERITKSYSLKTRTYDEFVETDETVREISNTGDKPVNYGLRRIFNRIKVQVQDVGPKLVWQLHIRDPGRGLRTSKFVHFMKAEDIPPKKDLPVDAPAKPEGGIETARTQTALYEEGGRSYAKLALKEASGRKIVEVRIDSMKDLAEPREHKEQEKEPAPYRNTIEGEWLPDKKEYQGKVRVRPGNSKTISISFTYRWEPDEKAWKQWEDKKQEAVKTDTAEKRMKEFENSKKLLELQSKVTARPSNELRKEERYEILNRMVGHLFGNSQNPSLPNPKEIEFFHRFFDIEALFVFNHPSWWNPRRKTLMEEDKYPITESSEPAKLGKSLGWDIQLDGDNRRNEFLNSAWGRVCLPFKPGREKEAILWLATHVEGKLGFSLDEGPLADLVKDMQKFRKSENALGTQNEDYITVDHTVGAPDEALKPENVYPVVDEFTVTVPTEGFVYDQIEI